MPENPSLPLLETVFPVKVKAEAFEPSLLISMPSSEFPVTMLLVKVNAVAVESLLLSISIPSREFPVTVLLAKVKPEAIESLLLISMPSDEFPVMILLVKVQFVAVDDSDLHRAPPFWAASPM